MPKVIQNRKLTRRELRKLERISLSRNASPALSCGSPVFSFGSPLATSSPVAEPCKWTQQSPVVPALSSGSEGSRRRARLRRHNNPARLLPRAKKPGGRHRPIAVLDILSPPRSPVSSSEDSDNESDSSTSGAPAMFTYYAAHINRKMNKLEDDVRKLLDRHAQDLLGDGLGEKSVLPQSPSHNSIVKSRSPLSPRMKRRMRLLKDKNIRQSSGSFPSLPCLLFPEMAGNAQATDKLLNPGAKVAPVSSLRASLCKQTVPHNSALAKENIVPGDGRNVDTEKIQNIDLVPKSKRPVRPLRRSAIWTTNGAGNSINPPKLTAPQVPEMIPYVAPPNPYMFKAPLVAFKQTATTVSTEALGDQTSVKPPGVATKPAATAISALGLRPPGWAEVEKHVRRPPAESAVERPPPVFGPPRPGNASPPNVPAGRDPLSVFMHEISQDMAKGNYDHEAAFKAFCAAYGKVSSDSGETTARDLEGTPDKVSRSPSVYPAIRGTRALLAKRPSGCSTGSQEMYRSSSSLHALPTTSRVIGEVVSPPSGISRTLSDSVGNVNSQPSASVPLASPTGPALSKPSADRGPKTSTLGSTPFLASLSSPSIAGLGILGACAKLVSSTDLVSALVLPQRRDEVATVFAGMQSRASGDAQEFSASVPCGISDNLENEPPVAALSNVPPADCEPFEGTGHSEHRPSAPPVSLSTQPTTAGIIRPASQPAAPHSPIEPRTAQRNAEIEDMEMQPLRMEMLGCSNPARDEEKLILRDQRSALVKTVVAFFRVATTVFLSPWRFVWRAVGKP